MTTAPWRPVGQILDLLAWIGDGRRLTQTDRLTLADARALVEVLGTGDVIDPVVYGVPTRTTSSAELTELVLLLEWARTAGLVRVVKHRLLRGKRHARLAAQPEPVRELLFDALTAANFALDPHPGFDSLVCTDYYLAFEDIATVLYSADEAVPLGAIEAAVWERLSRRWILKEDSQVRERRRCRTDIDRILARASSLGAVRLDRDTAALTDLGRSDLARWRGEPGPGDQIWRIRVDLADMPGRSVWRSIELAPATTLPTLHRILQAAFVWEDYHLHAFTAADGTVYGPTSTELDFADETSATLADLFDPFGAATYVYDFGDDWEHRIVFEADGTAQTGVDYPRCAVGGGACPPEDCGGTTGYENLLAILADPRDDEHDHMLDWLGLRRAGDFDPDAFDIAAAQQRLRAIPALR